MNPYERSMQQYASERLRNLTKLLVEKTGAQSSYGLGGEFGYGVDFKNSVFEMHPYWWGECECEHDHKEDCLAVAPNFKSGNCEITWYKYIGRGMEITGVNKISELEAIFDKAEESLG